MTYFLAKTDLVAYSINGLERDQTTTWDGVRNAQAMHFIQSMQPGDDILIYHSQGEAALVGLACVTSEPRPDPQESKSWVIDLAFVRHLSSRVTLRVSIPILFWRTSHLRDLAHQDNCWKSH